MGTGVNVGEGVRVGVRVDVGVDEGVLVFDGVDAAVGRLEAFDVPHADMIDSNKKRQ